MASLFIKIYQLFVEKSYLFYLFLALLVVVSIFGVSKLTLNEDINAVIPQSEKKDEIMRILDSSKLSDQLIFMIEPDSLQGIDAMKSSARALNVCLLKDTLVNKMANTTSAIEMMQVYQHFSTYPYLYLSDADYLALEEKLSPPEIALAVQHCYVNICSPTGLVAARKMLNDPLGIAGTGLKKLETLRIDDNFQLKDGFLFTKDDSVLMLFMEPKYSSNMTNINATLIDSIDAYIERIEFDNKVKISYYGGTAIAVANAKQIKQDIMVTVSLAVLLLLLLFLAVFKRISNVAVLFMPIVLGMGLAVAILSFVYGSMSAISLSVGAVLIGISIDYSLHIFIHFQETRDLKTTLKHIVEPLIISSITTSSAFLSLLILHSEALKQLGLFVALTIFLVAVFILTLVPFLLSKLPKVSVAKSSKLAQAWDNFDPKVPHLKWVFICVMLLSIFFTFVSKDLKFNSDISTLNFMSEELRLSEHQLASISSETAGTMYVISEGKTLEEALLDVQTTVVRMDTLVTNQELLAVSEVTAFIVPKAVQREKIKQWNAFWDKQDRNKLKERFIQEGSKYKIKASGFSGFYRMISPVDTATTIAFSSLTQSLFSNYVFTSDSIVYVASIVKVAPEKRNQVYLTLSDLPNTTVIDKGRMVSAFFDGLRDNFNTMVLVSQVVLFLIILLFLGRIELALITFIPIALSWIWTVGLMTLFGVEFNIFSVIVSTLIFGLGVDYSIFLLKGLQADYKYGNVSMKSYRQSIFLSALTTIAALGVLIFAEHPALRSIAFSSIFGIISVVLIANVLIPSLFKLLVGDNVKRASGKYRIVTLKDLLVSIIFFCLFLVGVLFLTFSIPIFAILPLAKCKKQYAFHWLLSGFFSFIARVAAWSKLEILNKELLNFNAPAIITSNHQSHIDLVLILMLHPKIIVLTNQWVWNNPFYGFIVKYANYYPLTKGVDNGLEKIGKMIDLGYSVLIFPEGTRSSNGKINKFQAGALYLADYFNLPIQPILLKGPFEALPKTDFLLKPARITMKVLPRFTVDHVDLERNESYKKQAAAFTQYYREAYKLFCHESTTPANLYSKLVSNYIYKGPILENYAKIKIKMEGAYAFFHGIIPTKGTIVDIGCGYGFLSIMLKMLSPAREILGLDYDEDKIGVARHIAETYEGLSFSCEDIVRTEMKNADVFILNDVLHYMPIAVQDKVLEACFGSLNEGGMILVRDANNDDVKGTKGTALTEFFSIKLLHFNKTQYNDIAFFSEKKLIEKANKAGFSVQVEHNSRFTSNTVYMITKSTV